MTAWRILFPVLAVSSCGALLAPVAPPAAFVPSACAFAVPSGVSVRCGWLTVPESRTAPHGRQVRLHVAIYASRAARPEPDPILWLVGGPGGRAHALSSALFERVVEPYLDRRDFIVLDVRGTGVSQPALDCPDGRGDTRDWLRACRDSLREKADLGSYNSAAVAADVDDLRRALGLRKWNLLGESYGTRLALTAMRDRPAGIRAVVLDSVVPLEVDQYADNPGNFDRALTALFQGCAADRNCARAFPALRAALLEAAAQLDRAPRRLTGEWRGARYDVVLDGRGFLSLVRMALYESEMIPLLPLAISEMRHGRVHPLLRQAAGTEAVIQGALVDVGANLAYHCSEEVPFTDVQRLRREDERLPWMRHLLMTRMPEACALWHAGRADPRETRPVASNIPTLLLAGEYDPATPPAYAETAISHLSRAHLFVFQGMGHWLTATTASGCPSQIVLEFLDHPERRPSGCSVERTWVLGHAGEHQEIRPRPAPAAITLQTTPRWSIGLPATATSGSTSGPGNLW